MILMADGRFFEVSLKKSKIGLLYILLLLQLESSFVSTFTFFRMYLEYF